MRTRFGAALDLTWSGPAATAVLRPSRGHRIEVRTPGGTRRLDLVAGEDRVLDLRTR